MYSFETVYMMPPGSGKNDRLKVIWFSVLNTSGTVRVIRRNVLSNTSGATAPDSLNTCPKCERQRWIFTKPTIFIWYTGLPKLGLDPKDIAILGSKACCRHFVNLTQLGPDLPTAWLTVEPSCNCSTLTYGITKWCLLGETTFDYHQCQRWAKTDLTIYLPKRNVEMSIYFDYKLMQPGRASMNVSVYIFADSPGDSLIKRTTCITHCLVIAI